MKIFVNLLCAFGGTAAFSILYNIERRFYLLCGLTGLIGWAAYLAAEPYCSVTVSTLAGACVVVFLSRIFSVWKKCPMTVFMIAGIFPLIPGSSIYYAAYHFVLGDYMQAVLKAVEAVKISFAIVVGIHLNDAIPARVFQKTYWQERFRKRNARLQGK